MADADLKLEIIVIPVSMSTAQSLLEARLAP